MTIPGCVCFFSRLALITLTCYLGACAQAPAEVVYGTSPLARKSHSNIKPLPPLSNSFTTDSFSKDTYTVSPGDTLASIARAQNLNWRELAEQNHLYPPYNVYAGQTISLSSQTQTNTIDTPKKTSIAPPPIPTTKPILTTTTTTTPASQPFPIEKTPLQNITPPTKPGELATLPIPPNPHAEPTLVKSSSPLIPMPLAKPKQYQSITELTSSSIPAGNELTHSKGKGEWFGSGTPTFTWPLRGDIVKRFGAEDSGIQNDGINITATENTDILSAGDGKVIYVGDRVRNFGNLLMIKHKGNFITTYAHTNQIFVNVGDKVKKGQVVASVGSTGNVSKPQLHFAIHKETKALDPETLLP